MIDVRNGVSIGILALVVVLGLLDAGIGIGVGSWATGIACAVGLSVAVTRSAARCGVECLGPADLVTLSRVTLACGVAALVADSFPGGTPEAALVVLAAVALALDAVDGRVARRTGTSSAFGARLDGEADAFLMLVLSVHVAQSVGTWVLVMGAARYLFAMAGWVLPWMRAQLPARYWRKVVTATAGIALVFAASGLGPGAMTYAALGGGFVLLAESFGRDVWWLWSRRSVGEPASRTALDAARPQPHPSP